MEKQICIKCKEEKDVSEFHKHGIRNNKIRYHSYCKNCVKEVNALTENRKKASLRTQKWAKENPEKTKNLRIKYQAKIRGTEKYNKKVRERQKKRYDSDPNFREYMRNASIKYEQSEKGRKKRREIAKRWINSLSEDELKSYQERQRKIARKTLCSQSKDLHDSYISKQLVGHVDKTIPKEFIEAKRILLQIHRRLKELNKAG